MNDSIRSERERIAKFQGCIAAGFLRTLGLKTYGDVVGASDVSGWRDIIAVYAGGDRVVGLKADGTVVKVGHSEYDGTKIQCDAISGLRGITSIAVGGHHIVALSENVIDNDWKLVNITVVGLGAHGQCNVGNWEKIAPSYPIISVAAGWAHTVCAKANGMVLAVGDNKDGQCNVGGWRDIVSVSAGYYHTVGLKADGTVVAVGDNKSYNPNTKKMEYAGQCDTQDWRDIVSVSAGNSHTVGLKADGTVVAVGENDRGQCNVGDWRDIVSVSAGYSHTVGLKTDGTVVETSLHSSVDSWRHIGPFSKKWIEVKAEIESEKNSLTEQIDALNKEISAISENTDGYANMVELQNKIQKLNSEKSELGFFKFKEKKVIQEQIDSANNEIAPIRARIDSATEEVQKRISPLRGIIEAIDTELTKRR